MDAVAALLHLLGFAMPAVCVALCTTLAARLFGARSGMRWWLEWLLASGAGTVALLAALWAMGRDGTMAGYAALVACCGTLAWLLSLRRR